MNHVQDDRERLLAEAFVGLADTLVDDYDIIDVLDRLVAHSVALLAADAAGILLLDPNDRLRLVASSNEQSGWTEVMQIQADEGPCVDCVRTAQPVTVTDLDADTTAERWPRLTAALRAHVDGSRTRFRSVHALPLRLRGRAIGGLNLFHSRPGPLPGSDLLLGQALADVATIGILQERALRQGEVLAEQLHTALTNRVAIEQAKGVLAQSGNLTMEGAFDRLRRYARGRTMLLGEVAQRVVTDPAFARHLLDTSAR